MEKEMHQPESLATVTIKPDYPPSEVYSSEPPPFSTFQAYQRPQSAAVQVAKIVAVTVVLVSVVLGGFILASAYVTANASCRQLEQELELISEAADRFQATQQQSGQQLPQAEALIQEQPLKRHINDVKSKPIDNNSVDDSADSNESSSSEDDASSSSASSSSENKSQEDDQEPDQRIHFKLPLQLDFDDLAGALIEKNQKSRMNCIVEKKRAEEVVDHQPKTLRLPFGVNLTTDPRFERLSGERMAIFCESGNMQQQKPREEDDDDDSDESSDESDTIMIQPVMIPIPHTSYQTHMPMMQQPQPQPQMQQIAHAQHMQRIFPVIEGMRPPMPPQPQPQQPQPQSVMPEFPPRQVLQHIAQQIIAQNIMEAQKRQQQEMQQQQHERLPLPEEVLTQLNRLPQLNRENDVIVAVADNSDIEGAEKVENNENNNNFARLQVVQQPRTTAEVMNGRQTYARGLMVPISVPMAVSVSGGEQQVSQPEPQLLKQEEQRPQQEEEPQALASEEGRPHYVQPRSVRSVDALLEKSQKRVKRCSCDCAC